MTGAGGTGGGEGGGGQEGKGLEAVCVWRPGGGGQAGERREEPLCTRLVRSALCVASVCV